MADVAPASTNGSSGAPQAPVVAPVKPDATGPQTPAKGAVRGPDGKFAKPEAPAPEAPPEKRKVRIRDVELDEDAAWAELQRGRQAGRLLTEAQKRATAAEAREKAYADRRTRAREDLGAILEDLELTPEQERELLSRRLYAKHIEPSQLTEEQRALREANEKLARYEAEKKTTEEKSAADAQKRAADHAKESLATELHEAAKAGRIPGAEPGKPGGALAIRRIAEKMLAGETAGHTIPLAVAVAAVRDDLARDTLHFVSSAPLAERKELWGEEAFRSEEKLWREHFLAKLKSPAAPVQPARAVPGISNGSPKRLTPQEFKEKFGI